MIKQTSNTINFALQTDAISDLLEAERMALLFAISLIVLSIPAAVSISSAVDIISINAILGILNLIIILPILISGIINLILIIR